MATNYLYGDFARDGKTGIQRLTEVAAADDARHGFSRMFRSAYALGDLP
jgi:hypothetical protein